MESVVLVIHLLLALAIIGLVLLQRSEGGGLGIGGGGGGLGNLASARGTANALTRMTAICAAGFFITSLTLGVMATAQTREQKGILENVTKEQLEIQAPVEGAIKSPAVTYTPPSDPVVDPEVVTDIEAPVEAEGTQPEATPVPAEVKTEEKPTEQPTAPDSE